MSEIAQNEFNDKTNIKVVGVGGAGGNAVNRMIAEGLQNVEFVAVNTDAKDLLRSDADARFPFPISPVVVSVLVLTRSVEPRRPRTTSRISKRRLGVPTWCSSPAGEGGGTGTGASPIVARAAHQQGALTIAVVTRPFSFEGPQRSVPPNTASTTCARKSTR